MLAGLSALLLGDDLMTQGRGAGRISFVLGDGADPYQWLDHLPASLAPLLLGTGVAVLYRPARFNEWLAIGLVTAAGVLAAAPHQTWNDDPKALTTLALFASLFALLVPRAAYPLAIVALVVLTVWTGTYVAGRDVIDSEDWTAAARPNETPEQHQERERFQRFWAQRQASEGIVRVLVGLTVLVPFLTCLGFAVRAGVSAYRGIPYDEIVVTSARSLPLSDWPAEKRDRE